MIHNFVERGVRVIVHLEHINYILTIFFIIKKENQFKMVFFSRFLFQYQRIMSTFVAEN